MSGDVPSLQCVNGCLFFVCIEGRIQAQGREHVFLLMPTREAAGVGGCGDGWLTAVDWRSWACSQMYTLNFAIMSSSRSHSACPRC